MRILALLAPPVGNGTTGHLSVGGTPILLPDQINSVSFLSGTYGINIIKLGIDLLLFAGVLLTLGFIFFGGFKWLISQGDKKKIEEARNTLIFSVIGFVVMCLSFLIINIIAAFFHVSFLQ